MSRTGRSHLRSRLGRALGRGVVGLAVLAGCTPAPVAAVKNFEPPDERFVFFAIAKTDVLAEGNFSIGYVTALLDAEPALRVLVVGHADPHGRAETNRELSFRRARAVRKALIDHGINGDRVVTAAPREQSESSLSQAARRADLFVYDPRREEPSRRVGYAIEIRSDGP